MIKKVTNKHIKKIPENPSLYEIQKMHFVRADNSFSRVLSLRLKKRHPKEAAVI